jgi:threonyl-tRNA synthetase
MGKYPFMIIVGDQEMAENTLSIRRHGGEDLGSLSVAAFVDLIGNEISGTLKTFELS